MPLYEYRCTKCKRRTEKIESVSGPHLKKCPHCGGKVEPMLSAPAIQFKGSGWYVTDYAGKSGGNDSAPAEKSRRPVRKKTEAQGSSKAPRDALKFQAFEVGAEAGAEFFVLHGEFDGGF